jgi:eukaryotic-like serine/threonine-protein kinase
VAIGISDPQDVDPSRVLRLDDRGLRLDDTKAPAALPSELLEKADRRLSLLAIIMILEVLVALGAGFLPREVDTTSTRLWLDRGRCAGLLVLSSVVLVILQRARPSPRHIAGIGVAYKLTGSLIMSLSFFAMEPVLHANPSQLTWLGVWIVVFPVVVPALPGRTAVTSLAAASTAPLVFAVAMLVRGDPWPPASVLVGTFLPYFMCAGVSVVPSMVVASLARDLHVARAAVRDYGAYRLVEQIGKGGMGEVWRAEHRALARPAAVKIVRPYTDPAELKEALERFAREARATAQLRSAHTMSLYDYGVAQDGTAYYAMELLDGIDLDELVRRTGPLPPARAIDLVLQVSESLSEAHAAGLVHRDMKPANVFLARLGVAVDVVKVMDFGLVALAQPVVGSARLTNPKTVLGTPAYMAPEQIVSPEQVDGRADIYALGCVLHWLLTGRTVFENTSFIQMVIDHSTKAPVPPSRINPRVSPDLDAVVLDCLRKDPADRPQTALALYDRLAQCAESTESTWTRADAQAWWVEHLPELAPGLTRATPELVASLVETG